MIAESLINNCKIIESIKKNKIFAVVRSENADKTVAISKALIKGGIKIIEIAMNCDDAPLAIEEISRIDGVSVSAGSVITADQAERAINAGAKLIASPVEEMRLIKLCKGRRVPIITAASTPNEAYNAWKVGVNLIKIFPAQVLGGPDYIKDILTPMPFLHLVPTGGVDLDNFIDYLKAGAVAVGMGKAFYAAETDLETITQKAEQVTKKLENYLLNINDKMA